MQPRPYNNARDTWEIIQAIELGVKIQARDELVQEMYSWLIEHPDASVNQLMDEIEDSNRRYARKSI
jgi:hypothetical protein